MRIKKLELNGFKSFKDRTVIQFDQGITGVVGPNGCGKSNIVDALLWVMGEMSAKELRGSSMVDVIFAGAEGYAAHGMCEVSLTLENDGGAFPAQYLKHSEIMVTRRLHRDGEGEYLINKEPARLKDVQEIFMDTGAGSKGFSIIQQGMIGRIITAKPEDRRHLIEEAAGITKFKARKKESQRKIIATDQNLVRLQDILGELKRQIDSLERQAQRAERYRNVKTQIEDLDLWLSSRQYKELRLTADDAQKNFETAQSLEIQSRAELDTLSADAQVRKLEVLEKEKQIEVQQQRLFGIQGETQKKELELQQLKFEIEQGRRNEVMTGTLIQEQRARLELLQIELKKYQVEHAALESERSQASAQLTEKNEVYQKVSARIKEIDENLTISRRDMFAVGQAISSLDARLQSLQTQIEEQIQKKQNEDAIVTELREKRQELSDRRMRIFKDLQKERQLSLDFSSDLQSFEANRQVLTVKSQESRAEMESFRDELSLVGSKLLGLESLQNNFEGFAEGVKKILHWQKVRFTETHADGSQSHHFQPLADLIEIEPQYEKALSAALGPKLQTLLPKDNSETLEALQFLKSEKAGRSSFFVDHSGSAASSTSPQNEDGFLGLLSEKVKLKAGPEYLSKFFSNIAVVENLTSAIAVKAKYPDWIFVTEAGDVLSKDGILTGGSSDTAESSVLERQREIRELTQKKSEWSGKLALSQEILKKVDQQLQNVVVDFESAQTRRQEQELKVSELRKDLERAETEFQNAERSVERQEKEILRLSEILQQNEQKRDEIQQHLTLNRENENNLKQGSDQLEKEWHGIRGENESLQSSVTELQIRTAAKEEALQGVGRQCAMLDKQVEDLSLQLSRINEESETNSSKMTEAQILLEEQKIEFEKMLNESQDLKLAVARERDGFEKLSEELRAIESQLSAAQQQKYKQTELMNEMNLKFEQSKMKEQYLIDQIRERYMLDLSEVFERYQKGGDPVAGETELKELREKIGRMGEVNLSAIQEFDETKTRYEFLTKQHQDLIDAKDQLRKVIDRINRICSQRFKETFDLVNDRFQKVFPVLFGGGEARLELLEDPEDGEMGVEIVAKPPGKKMQNVTLLSGGEKALTAVALVFSIFLVKPSPYCLLDEVDAPLDDANVYRFNDLVREMAKRSQIIVVTHNKHTMEVAGRLYGVTMQEKGVSTMVTVDLSTVNDII